MQINNLEFVTHQASKLMSSSYGEKWLFLSNIHENTMHTDIVMQRNRVLTWSYLLISNSASYITKLNSWDKKWGAPPIVPVNDILLENEKKLENFL